MYKYAQAHMYIVHLHYNITCTEKAICICESGYECSTVYGILPHFEVNACNMFNSKLLFFWNREERVVPSCPKASDQMCAIGLLFCYFCPTQFLQNERTCIFRLFGFKSFLAYAFLHSHTHSHTLAHIYKQLAWCQRIARNFTKFGQHIEHKYLEIELFNSALV